MDEVLYRVQHGAEKEGIIYISAKLLQTYEQRCFWSVETIIFTKSAIFQFIEIAIFQLIEIAIFQFIEIAIFQFIEIVIFQFTEIAIFQFTKIAIFHFAGKTMENVRKHVDIRLVQSKKRLQRLSSKPTYKGCTVFNKDLVAVGMCRAKVKLFKPSYSGMCILDLSKKIIYEWYYLNLKAKYQSNMRFLMSDTDSFLYWCQTEDIYQDMCENLTLFDTSNFPKNHKCFSEQRKKQIGLMKDETAGEPIKEFVGIRSKMYSFVSGSHEQKKIKGIAKPVIKRDLRFEMYKDTIKDEQIRLARMTTIRSFQHQLSCQSLNKVSLSPFDDKRYPIDSISSLPYGHYKIKQHQ